MGQSAHIRLIPRNFLVYGKAGEGSNGAAMEPAATKPRNPQGNFLPFL